MPSSRNSMVRRLLGVSAGLGCCASAMAQFGASGGPSLAAERWVEWPWIVIAALLVVSWVGPKVVRPFLRRALAHAFIAIVLLEVFLFAAMLLLSAIFGPNTAPLSTVGMLWILGVMMSGMVICTFTALSLCVRGVRGLIRMKRVGAASAGAAEPESPPP